MLKVSLLSIAMIGAIGFVTPVKTHAQSQGSGTAIRIGDIGGYCKDAARRQGIIGTPTTTWTTGCKKAVEDNNRCFDTNGGGKVDPFKGPSPELARCWTTMLNEISRLPKN